MSEEARDVPVPEDWVLTVGPGWRRLGRVVDRGDGADVEVEWLGPLRPEDKRRERVPLSDMKWLGNCSWALSPQVLKGDLGAGELFRAEVKEAINRGLVQCALRGALPDAELVAEVMMGLTAKLCREIKIPAVHLMALCARMAVEFDMAADEREVEALAVTGLMFSVMADQWVEAKPDPKAN